MKIVVTEINNFANLPNGTYEAEFMGGESGEKDTKFGRRNYTTLKFNITQKPFDNNKISKTYFWPVINGSPIVTKGSALGKAIYEITGKYEISDEDIGNKVFLKLENQEKSGKTYTNIVNIMQHPERTSKVVKTTTSQPQQQIPQKSIEKKIEAINEIEKKLSIDDLDI